ncbi:hypothetical protein TOPH_04673 [Tolypocladium ophioglossoides CBS 100239]|uniref:N-acetyltransferase domain-containing protein n=1 Tax=Tolypocladium ophioglossoides (strain CBS 100239) TaxID=1163406 RepID=A0A0L0N979_TOLOC|nr:hypothetical protein TOPH_04673 [Tolypocladium ophioglossoides CBS 100239]
MAFIRPYKPSDSEAMAHICRATLPPSLEASEPARRLAPYVWTHQYTHLSPATCFVLDAGDGTPVGYCIGCPDVPAFCAAYAAYTTAVLDPSPDVRRPPAHCDPAVKAPWLVDGLVSETALAQMAYFPQWLLLDGNEDLLCAYKATMHIDLLDEWQRRGWGRKLIETFVASVRDMRMQDGSDSRGIWLGVAGDNAKVVPFYQKVGFKVKERAVKTSSITMVRDY